jgi:hypothetical protein
LNPTDVCRRALGAVERSRQAITRSRESLRKSDTLLLMWEMRLPFDTEATKKP